MKTLKEALSMSEALFSRKNIKSNPFELTKYDLKYEIEGFPMGVVVRMLEEQELQGNKPDVTIFQRDNESVRNDGGFNWDKTEDKFTFWRLVIRGSRF